MHDPSWNGVVETPLVRIFGILEELPVFRKVKDRLEVRSDWFNTPFRVTFYYKTGNIKSRSGVGCDLATVNYLA